MRSLTTFLCALIGLGSSLAQAAVTPVWSTGVAVPGEKVALYLIDTDVKDDAFFLKTRPSVSKARLELLQPQAGANPLDPDRANAEIFPMIITPDSPGELTVPDIEVEYRSGRKERISIPPLPVVSTAEIRWQETPLPFGALWYTSLKEGYTDQPVKTALKIFLPGDCEAPIAPQLHSVGVRIGNFQAAVQGLAAMIQGSILNPTTAYAKGKTWRTADFCGTLTPFRDGNSDIGGKLIIAQRQGFFNTGRAEAELPVLRLGALPLPPGAPADFAHAVGTFSISAQCAAESLAMNEAVEVELTVTGTGNLEQLECPEPTDTAAWKMVPATRKPLLGPNGETRGMVFSRLMRPTTEVRGIPSFAFSYFDPQAMEYRRAATAPLPLSWRKADTAGSGVQQSAAEPPPAGTVPVAEMADIYGYMDSELYGRSVNLPHGLLYLLYAPAAAILLYVLGSLLCRRYAAGAAARRREQELARLEREAEPLAFLKAIGSYIESHVPAEALTPELQEILHRRDDEAFRPAAQAHISPEERRSMVKALRKALSHAATAVVLLFCLLPAAEAGDEAANAYRAGQYSHALQWLEQTPVPQGQEARVLYNKGNCEYRLGNSGQAALLYAQALLADPGLAEAKANLAFIQRKEGALLPLALPEDEVFTWLTPSQLAVCTIASTALTAFLLALMLLLRERGGAKLKALTLLSLLPVMLCAADHLYYATRQVPNPAATPPADTAMVLRATALRTAADPKGSPLMDVTVATPLHVLARRGDWCYVETYATGTRGWIQSNDTAILREGSAPRPATVLRF